MLSGAGPRRVQAESQLRRRDSGPSRGRSADCKMAGVPEERSTRGQGGLKGGVEGRNACSRGMIGRILHYRLESTGTSDTTYTDISIPSSSFCPYSSPGRKCHAIYLIPYFC